MDWVRTDITIAINTKMNHIMVSFWDYCNSIFIDRVPCKYEYKPIFSWYVQTYIFS